MAERENTLNAELAARLPPQVNRLLGKCVPCSPDLAANEGILAGLLFALKVLQAAPLTVEQIRAALGEATCQVRARVAEQTAAEACNTKLKAVSLAEVSEEFANIDQKTLVSSDQLLRELEQVLRDYDDDVGNGATA